LNRPAEWSANYAEALGRFVAGAGEYALSEAYEIGRQALTGGLGLLDLVAVHDEAIRELLLADPMAEPLAVLAAARPFFIEALSPFEMHYRRADESTSAWRRLNELLEDEIKRIAHALHDEAGSILAQASLEMDLATAGLTPEIRERMNLARSLLDDTGQQLRHLSHELRPTILDDLGLLAAVEFLALGIERRSGVPIEVRGRLSERLPATVEIATYRIVQEALNNALRHAGRNAAIKVSVQVQKNSLHCVVRDDGVGFDVTAVLRDGRHSGLGLIGMRERASAAGGGCLIQSEPGRGTTVEISMPAW
jgi:signal transduction histidine kinase